MVRFCLFSLALLTYVPCFAQFPNEVSRLMDTARLWVTVEYFHPYLVYRDVDWDQALIITLPKVRKANNAAEYEAALSGMLAGLHDPETFVLNEKNQAEKVIKGIPVRHWTRLTTATGNFVMVEDRPSSSESLELEISGMRIRLRTSDSNSEAVTRNPEVRRTPTELYPEPSPPPEARLLAAIKMWGAIHYFFAYKDLVDEDWDEVFASYLPKFIEARDALDYNLTFADLLTHLTDTNTKVRSKILDQYFGEATVGLQIHLLDKYPIITAIFDPAARAAGIQPGDVLKRIGSESTTDRFRRLVQYVPASTAQRSGYDTICRIANGAPDTEVELGIENDQGETHPIKLKRSVQPSAPQRSTETVQILPGNIGYLDLDRLPPAAANAAMSQMQSAKSIILDLRGSAAAAAVIASHLTGESSVAAALITTPIALHPDVPDTAVITQTASTFAVQALPRPQAPQFKGKTIALIDERTIGEAEYAGLLFEAANKTDFVGVPSAGADSRIAELSLPGGITLTYSTQDIRHGNGGKLQRLGLQPNIIVPTTAKGLRAGKDEPLDAALAYLSR